MNHHAVDSSDPVDLLTALKQKRLVQNPSSPISLRALKIVIARSFSSYLLSTFLTMISYYNKFESSLGRVLGKVLVKDTPGEPE